MIFLLSVSLCFFKLILLYYEKNTFCRFQLGAQNFIAISFLTFSFFVIMKYSFLAQVMLFTLRSNLSYIVLIFTCMISFSFFFTFNLSVHSNYITYTIFTFTLIFIFYLFIYIIKCNMFFLFPKSSLIIFLLEQGLENIFCKRLESRDFRLCGPRPVRVTITQLCCCGVKAATENMKRNECECALINRCLFLKRQQANFSLQSLIFQPF